MGVLCAIFAISGLHVACIAACLLVVLRALGISRERAALILIPLVWFYTLATGWQSSAVRSALMSTFVFAGWAIRRPTELLNSTAGAAFLILLFEPEQLFQASFQLSFAVVAAIALILGPAHQGEPWHVRVQNRLLGYDPLLPADLRPKWKKWLEIPIGFVLGNFAISAAAWIGSNPLTAYYFNMVTPISLLANLIAVPLSSLSLAGTLGSLLLPPLGVIFNYISWATMWATIASMRWLSHLSWGYFYVPKPNLWFFVGYFAIVAICVIPLLRTSKICRHSCAFAFSAFLAWFVSIVPSVRSTIITMLPARGSPVLVDAPGRGEDLLINCSNRRGAEQLLKRFLHGQGFGSIGTVVLSQADADHAGGLPFTATNFSPHALFVPEPRGRSRVYHQALEAVERERRVLNRIASPDQVLNWKALHPQRDQTFARADDNAVILKSEVNGWTVLFLSDLGKLGRKALLERQHDLRSDILIGGTPEALDDPELLAAIAPRLVVVGAMDAPFKRGRAREIPKCLRASGALVAVCSNENAVTLTLTRGECRFASGTDAGISIVR